jgi:cyclopropane-fatty-acyl-phospholipid synthase
MMQVLGEEQRTKVFNSLFCDYGGPTFAIHSWDGWCWHSSENQKPACTIDVRSAEALGLLIESPDEVGLGEAFVRGEIDVKGDLFSVFSVGEHVLTRPTTLRQELLQRLAATLPPQVD